SAGRVCDAHAAGCDFMRAILASTEDVWAVEFALGQLPDYGVPRASYRDPTLVVYETAVSTGCGVMPAAFRPFYCPKDGNLYIDPTYLEQMGQRLGAPGDFARAYIIAHEVGHHVQTMIGARARRLAGETQLQTSVRLELQADCFAGVWGNRAREAL